MTPPPLPQQSRSPSWDNGIRKGLQGLQMSWTWRVTWFYLIVMLFIPTIALFNSKFNCPGGNHDFFSQ